MLTLLISNTAFSSEDWQDIIKKSCEQISFKPLSEIKVRKDQTLTLESDDSFCGLECLLQSNGFKIFLNSLPSRKDFRLFCKIIELASKKGCSFADEVTSSKFLKSESLNQLFEGLWNSESASDKISVTRNERKMDLKPWLNNSASPSDQESFLLKKIKALASAKEAETFPVDGKESAIWDGSSLWVNSSVKMLLFSQAYFKGKICGEIETDKLKEILADKITHAVNGFLLPEARKMSGEDIDRLNESLSHYEKKEAKQKLEKLSIEAGKLEEISYSMSRALFEGVKLSKITDRYIKDGISKAQLEVAALAVSSMLEIAATSQGESLDTMQKKLKDKCRLSVEAAFSVASGFVNAAKEAEPNKKKVNWLKAGILLFAVCTVIWFFFFK